MDTLHTVMRTIRGETKSKPDHMIVFREFLNQLERISRAGAKRPVKGTKSRRTPKR